MEKLFLCIYISVSEFSIGEARRMRENVSHRAQASTLSRFLSLMRLTLPCTVPVLRGYPSFSSRHSLFRQHHSMCAPYHPSRSLETPPFPFFVALSCFRVCPSSLLVPWLFLTIPVVPRHDLMWPWDVSFSLALPFFALCLVSCSLVHALRPWHYPSRSLALSLSFLSEISHALGRFLFCLNYHSSRHFLGESLAPRTIPLAPRY